jgi:UDP-glucose 4-epimerase
MKALVTGGAGFIGSNLVDYLVSKGHDVIVLDDESAESNEEFFWRDGAKRVSLDICDADGLDELFSREKEIHGQAIDWVFHLAAESRIQPTLERPQRACEVNFVGTCNVLQAARLHGTKRVVYSSTSAGYGLKNEPPLVETMSRECLNPYSVTKVAAEDLCKMYHSLWGLETVILRYFNVYGERQPIAGQYAPVIGIFLRQKAAGETMTIVGDGEQRRDFTHVKDVVSANYLSATTTDEKALGEVFNVGTGTNHSVLEVSELIGGDHSFIPKRPGEADTTLADISKIRNILGWEPTVKLEDWIKENNV